MRTFIGLKQAFVSRKHRKYPATGQCGCQSGALPNAPKSAQPEPMGGRARSCSHGPNAQAPNAPGSEELFRLMVESAVDYAIFSMSPEGLVTSWNTGAPKREI